RGGDDAPHPRDPAGALRGPCGRHGPALCDRRQARTARHRGRGPRHRLLLAGPAHRQLRGPGRVQLPSEQEHDHRRRRRDLGRLARGADSDRAAPLARAGKTRPGRLRHIAPRGQIQSLGCRGRGRSGAAPQARGIQRPAPSAQRALLRAVGRGAAGAVTGARRCRPQLARIHSAPAAARAARDLAARVHRGDEGARYRRWGPLPGHPPLQRLSRPRLSRGTVPERGGRRTADRDAAAVSRHGARGRRPGGERGERHPARSAGPMSPQLSAVIPVYNEQEGLPLLFERLYPALDALGRSYEVVFVDDGSSDASVAELREQFERRPDVTRVVLLARNAGQHLAILAAFAHSRGTYVITLDADLQNPPEEIEVAHAERAVGQTKYSLYRLIRLNFDLMTGFSVAPLQFLSMAGGVIALSSLILVVYLVIRRLIVGPEAEGLFTLFAIAFFLIGVALIGLGVVGEYVGRIYEQVRQRPRYMVAAVLEPAEEGATERRAQAGAAPLPAPLLRAARRGALNMHGSLLPKYRGRAPVNWAILKGERETGATLHYMVERADAGDIVDQLAVPILQDDDAREVFAKVTVAAETILARSLPLLLAGTAARRPQAIVPGQYFGRREPGDGRIDWGRPALEIHNLVRAVAPPFPGAFAQIAGERWDIHRTRVSARRAPAGVGVRLFAAEGECHIACADGAVLTLRAAATDRGPIALAARARELTTPLALR